MALLNITQAMMVRELGLSQGAISKIVNNSPSGSSHLHRVARMLQTTPAYLTGETADADADAPPPPVLSRDEAELVEHYRSLTPHDRETILRTARALSGAAMPSKQVHAPRRAYRGEKVTS